MRKILIILWFALGLVSFATQARADHVSWIADLGNGNSLVLYADKPCDHPVVTRHLPPDVADKLKAAALRWDDQDLAACWARVSEEYVFVIDQTGDSGAVPVRMFARQMAVAL